MYTKTKFHAKAYIFKIDGAASDVAVVGSSNFSSRGMGHSEDSNTELNAIERNDPAVEKFDGWFKEIWDEAEPYRDELIKIIDNSVHMVRKQTKDPEFISPSDLFRTIVCEHDDFDVFENNVLVPHQQLGVITAYNAIERYGGCMISDSVGLGKTFIGIRLAEIAQRRGLNVLILVPKSLTNNWKREIKRYFKNMIVTSDRLKIMTITEINNLDLKKKTDVKKLNSIKENYNFIVVDEAHRFRNYGEFRFIDKKYSGRKGHANLHYIKNDDTKIVLLTATPINNSIMDMYRLISLFTDTARLQNYHPEMSLECFKQYQKIVRDITEYKNTTNLKNLKNIDSMLDDLSNKKRSELSKINKIINEVMVLRTKQSIVKDYANIDISDMPTVSEIPNVVTSNYEPGPIYTMLYNDVQDLIMSLKIPHITRIKHHGAAINLSGLFRILLFKRLESSIHSFIISIDKLLEKEEKFKQDVEKNGLVETILKSNDNDLEDDMELTDFLDELEKPNNVDSPSIVPDDIAIDEAIFDIEKITEFKNKYSKNILLGDNRYHDPKLTLIKEIINNMSLRKILIFTQYADTAEYLYKSLKKFTAKQNISLDCVMGDHGRPVGNTALDIEQKIDRFAPEANKVLIEPRDEINIMIATDTLSEGVNLQDCSTIINYDLPWNPMRMVQRVGRVDRIGSKSRTTVYNIIPDKELEAFLSLLEKLEDKIKNITSIVGKESYILSEDEELDPKTIGIKLKEARLSTNYAKYENPIDDELHFETNDHHSKTILVLRQKMNELNLACSDNSTKIGGGGGRIHLQTNLGIDLK